MKLASNMFPFLCKLNSSKRELKLYGSAFFISPVPCILDELQKMRTHTRKKYASLVLLMANENSLSKDILGNVINDNDGMTLNEKNANF